MKFNHIILQPTPTRSSRSKGITESFLQFPAPGRSAGGGKEKFIKASVAEARLLSLSKHRSGCSQLFPSFQQAQRAGIDFISRRKVSRIFDRI